MSVVEVHEGNLAFNCAVDGRGHKPLAVFEDIRVSWR